MAIFGGIFYLTFTILSCRKITNWKIETPKSITSALIIIKKCFPIFLSAIFPIALNAIPKIYLQKYYGEIFVGVFSSLSAQTVVITTMATGMFAPLINKFSTYVKNNDFKAFKSNYFFILALFIVSGIICLTASLLFGPCFFSWLYGTEILANINVFYYLVIAIVFCTIATYSGTILVILDKLNYLAVTYFMALILGIIACNILIPTRGMTGAAWSLSIAYLFQIFTQIFGILIFNLKVNI